MNAKPTELPPRPPGAMKALLSGFNAVAANINVILLPVALDSFLWLGPRLTFASLTTKGLKWLAQMQAATGQTQALPPTVKDVFTNINLFSILRSFPMGVFSLMISNLAAQSPLGTRLTWDVSNPLALLGLPILLVPIGCLLGSLYYYMVSQAALQRKGSPGVLRAAFHSLLLAGAWQFVFGAAFFVVLLPITLVLQLLSGNFVASLIFLMIISWPLTWAALLIFFSAHAVFTNSKDALASLGQTFRMLRFGMPPMGWFALTALIISRAMDLLWLSAPADSWFTLIGILGHAFVSTGLLAASFIFYRDLSSWVEEALQWLNTHQITSARA